MALGGLSKWGAMPGLRMGWLACHDLAFVRKVRQAQGARLLRPAAGSLPQAIAARPPTHAPCVRVRVPLSPLPSFAVLGDWCCR